MLGLRPFLSSWVMVDQVAVALYAVTWYQGGGWAWDAAGLAVWFGLCAGLCSSWLRLVPQPRLAVAGLAFLLGSRVLLATSLVLLEPTVWVAVAALVAVLVGLWSSALAPLLRVVPARLRRGAVAHLGVLAFLVAAATGAAHATGRVLLPLAALGLLLSDLARARARFDRHVEAGSRKKTAWGAQILYALALLAWIFG